MFTGIIEASAKVLQKPQGQLILSRPSQFDDIQIGSSIAVSGVCLSVVAFDEQSMTFDVVNETWERSSLGGLESGSVVNLERALPADGRLEGHIVQGHVEGVGTVNEAGERLTIELDDELIKKCVQKGSIALDGVSLTIASVEGNTVSVALIPHTLEHSTLGKLQKGDSVNVETDILARYADKLLAHR